MFGLILPNFSIDFYIFDHTIKPILTYDCKIWTSTCKTVYTNNNILDILYQSGHGENLHIEYCKYVLSVHSNLSNLACVGELGRFPVH